jgi:hypothetical protein
MIFYIASMRIVKLPLITSRINLSVVAEFTLHIVAEAEQYAAAIILFVILNHGLNLFQVYFRISCRI